MKRYISVFEYAAELDAQGFERDKDISIEKEGPNDGCLHCVDGTLYSYPDHLAYYIHPKG